MAASENRDLSGAACRVSAVLLAAGSSRRFAGGSKLLADAGGRPLVAWAAAALAQSRVDEILVVTGPQPERIAEALAPWPVRLVHNPDHLAGMGTSIARGIAAVAPRSAGALVCPGDMPGITSALVDRLIAAFARGEALPIVHPLTPEGRQGNPVLWPRRCFGRLMALAGPGGGKALLAELAAEIVAVPAEDAGASLDVDTVADLERYRQALEERSRHRLPGADAGLASSPRRT